MKKAPPAPAPKAFPTSVNSQITDAVTQSNRAAIEIAMRDEIIKNLKERIAAQDNMISQLITRIPYQYYSNPYVWSSSGSNISFTGSDQTGPKPV